MAVSLFLSVFGVCVAYLIGVNMRHAFKIEHRKHLNNLELSALLESKLKSIDETKERMESLLLKNGFGRK